MLLLIFSNRNFICLVKQNVSKQKHDDNDRAD